MLHRLVTSRVNVVRIASRTCATAVEAAEKPIETQKHIDPSDINMLRLVGILVRKDYGKQNATGKTAGFFDLETRHVLHDYQLHNCMLSPRVSPVLESIPLGTRVAVYGKMQQRDDKNLLVFVQRFVPLGLSPVADDTMDENTSSSSSDDE